MAGSSGPVCIRVLQYWYLSTGTSPSAYHDTRRLLHNGLRLNISLISINFFLESCKGVSIITAALSLIMTCQCDLPRCSVDSQLT